MLCQRFYERERGERDLQRERELGTEGASERERD